MRILLCLLLLFLSYCSAQNYSLPLSALSVSIIANLNNGPIPTQPTLTPSFSDFSTKNTRYSVEISSSDPLKLSITSIGGSLLIIRKCGNQLFNPSSSTGSHCSFESPISNTYPGNNTIPSIVNINVMPGISYIELIVGSNNNKDIKITYLITVSISNTNDITANLLSLSTDHIVSRFNIPYSLLSSQYSLTYRGSEPGSNIIGVPFYLTAQKSVNTIYVQQCAGLSCSACSSDSNTNPPLRLTLPADVSVFGSFSSTDKPQNGRYLFNARHGNNCIRFINEAINNNNNPPTTITNTIQISLTVSNCGLYTNCSACATDTNCGWCLSQFVGLLGSCQPTSLISPGYGSAISNCIRNNNILSTPRWIFGQENCITVLKGDPRITGLQGQDFQVHGTPNDYYNLFTTTDLQINSRFVFLSSGRCDNFTACYTHAGTYIDQISFMTSNNNNNNNNKIKLIAKGIDQGMEVYINNKLIQYNDKLSEEKIIIGDDFIINYSHPRRIMIRTKYIIMTIYQSDLFFNIDSSLLNQQLLSEGSVLIRYNNNNYSPVPNKLIHGLIGQTWRNIVYKGNREYEGEISDYHVEDGLWGNDFYFNLFINNNNNNKDDNNNDNNDDDN